MNYFTPELFLRCQDPDPAAMDAADAAWEAAEARYEEHLQELGPALAPVSDPFAGILLHDAQVWGITRQGDSWTMILRTDIPPHRVVTLTYALTGEPYVDRTALPPGWRSGVMQFLYDEFDLIQDGDALHYLHSILFSNGWEIRVPFQHVTVTRAEPVYPEPDTALVPHAAHPLSSRA